MTEYKIAYRYHDLRIQRIHKWLGLFTRVEKEITLFFYEGQPYLIGIQSLTCRELADILSFLQKQEKTEDILTCINLIQNQMNKLNCIKIQKSEQPSTYSSKKR